MFERANFLGFAPWMTVTKVLITNSLAAGSMVPNKTLKRGSKLFEGYALRVFTSSPQSPKTKSIHARFITPKRLCSCTPQAMLEAY